MWCSSRPFPSREVKGGDTDENESTAGYVDSPTFTFTFTFPLD